MKLKIIAVLAVLLTLVGTSAYAAATAEECKATFAKGGLMYEASIGGQKFKFKPLKD